MPRALALVLFTLLLAGGVLAVPAARSASPDVVVSQVFAGGGNAGAPFTNDFVELFNRGATAVDVSGWTVQYASASGSTWQATALTGSIAPGHTPDRALLPDESATLPSVADIAIEPVASGVGRFAVPLAPAAS